MWLFEDEIYFCYVNIQPARRLIILRLLHKFIYYLLLLYWNRIVSLECFVNSYESNAGSSIL